MQASIPRTRKGRRLSHPAQLVVSQEGHRDQSSAAWQRHGHEPVVAEPKTGRSRRQVQLGSAVIDALRRHRLQPGIGFVFTRSDGRPLSRSIVDKAWTRLNERAGVPPVRFHDLRHTAATLLLGRGMHPKIVSEMLGHATVAITLDLYSHVTPTMQREAAATMDQLLSR
jgi:integrase